MWTWPKFAKSLWIQHWEQTAGSKIQHECSVAKRCHTARHFWFVRSVCAFTVRPTGNFFRLAGRELSEVWSCARCPSQTDTQRKLSQRRYSAKQILNFPTVSIWWCLRRRSFWQVQNADKLQPLKCPEPDRKKNYKNNAVFQVDSAASISFFWICIYLNTQNSLCMKKKKKKRVTDHVARSGNKQQQTTFFKKSLSRPPVKRRFRASLCSLPMQSGIVTSPSKPR